MDRASTLADLILKYQKSYYSGEAEITDEEFDLLWDELKSISPEHPLLQRIGRESAYSLDKIDGFPKAKHIMPMGSQDKASDPESFIAWAKKINPSSYIVQYKLDGASLGIQYSKGKLLRAVTRGDGITGDDITPNVLRMNGIVKNISASFSGGVRGEVIMTRDIWKSRHEDKANCRNAANGIMRRKDGSGCEDLTIICYDASFPGKDNFFRSEMEKIKWLEEQGFIVTDTREFYSYDEVVDYRKKVSDSRNKLNYDIDGLVIKDNLTDMIDLRRSRPEHQIAFKFDPEIAYSTLLEIEWSETGGTYTPIGVIEPVRLAGTIVKRANLNNPGMIRSMDLKIGSMIRIVKRGEIIPKIEGLAPEEFFKPDQKLTEIQFPEKCNSCNTKLKDIETRLFCPNPECPKKNLHRLEKWISVLDIRELGDKLLEQLFESGAVKNISDLYKLNEKELSEYNRMGNLSASKVYKNIMKKRQLSLASFIAGFNLEGVGELVMDKVISAGFNTLEKLQSLNENELSGIHGIGEIIARIIVKGLKDNKDEMEAVLSTGIISIILPGNDMDLKLNGLSFCFTGELNSIKRSHAGEKVKSLGGTVKADIVKDLDYLVTNDPDSGSAKAKKARELNIKVINELTFLEMINNEQIKQSTDNPIKDNSKQKELF